MMLRKGSEMRKAKWGLGLVLLILVLGLLPLVAACGGEETDETTTTAAPTETTAAPTETTAGEPTETTAGSTEPTNTETLKIGGIFQLTDWYSAVDAGEIGDTQVVADLINTKYPLIIGDTKYEIELVTQDGKSTPDGNTAAANKLVYDDQVKFVVGPSAYFNAFTSPIFEPAQVMHVAGYNTFVPGEMDESTPYGFLGSNGPVASSSVAMKALKREYPDVKNVARATADESTVTYTKDMWDETITSNGFNIAGDLILYSNSATDFNPIAVQLNAIADADAYWFPLGTPPAYGNITKALRALGNTKPVVFPNYGPSTLAIVGPEGSTNILSTQSYLDDDPYNPDILQEVLDARDTDLQWFGMTPNALWVLVEAMRVAQSVEPADVVAAWESMGPEVSTLYGEGLLCGTETYGLKQHAVIYGCAISKIVDGEITQIEWVMPDATP
jgi:branched-chain amino acid transport system substrate-binding protein